MNLPINRWNTGVTMHLTFRTALLSRTVNALSSGYQRLSFRLATYAASGRGSPSAFGLLVSSRTDRR